MFPRLVDFGNLALPTYGVLSAIGLVLGLMICVHLAKREGIDPERAWNMGIIAILAAIAGSKLLLFLNDWGYYSQQLPQIFSLATLRAIFSARWGDPYVRALIVTMQAGGVWYGGLLLGLAAAIVYMRWRKMPVLKTMDAFAPGIAFGHILGRAGCFAAGCCYGTPTQLPWGVTFTSPIANYLSGTPLGVRLHPTQLYEAGASALIFVFLLWLLPRKRFDGQVMGAYFFLYGVARYFLEFVRDDPERGSVFGGAMTVTQLIAIVMVVIGGAMWMRRDRSLPQYSAQSAS